jgi:PilZ domain
MLSPANTRRSRRYQVDLPVRVFLQDGTSSLEIPGRGTEISERGMALYAGIQKQLGDIIDLEFQSPGHHRTTGKIRSRSGYCYGLEFVTPLDSGPLANESRRQLNLKVLADQVYALALKSSPIKRKFVSLAKKNPSTMQAYVERCAELEGAVQEYEPVLEEMASLLGQAVQALQGDPVTLSSFMTIKALVEKNLESTRFVKEELAFAKELPNFSPPDQLRLYEQNIRPLREAQARLTADGIKLLSAAKSVGVPLPQEMYNEVS